LIVIAVAGFLVVKGKFAYLIIHGAVPIKDSQRYLYENLGEGSQRYEDRENLIYYVEYNTFQGTLELDQVESLAYYGGWENDADGNPTIPLYKYIPIK